MKRDPASLPVRRKRRPRRRAEKSALRKRLEYGIVRVVASRVEKASDAQLTRWGAMMGRIASLTLAKRRRLALRNLREIFPEKSDAERSRIAEKCWSHYARMILEYLRMRHMPVEEIARRCDIVNRSFMEDAISQGKGVLLLSAHFGNWEIGGNLLVTFNQPITTVARPLDNEYLEQDLAQARSRPGIELVDRREAARPLMKALAAKRIVVLLVDQSVAPSEGVVVPFLGKPAWTTPAPARFALRFGVPIQLVFCLPTEGSRTLIEFEKTIYVDRLPESERTAEAITERINDVISHHIRKNPEYWLWMHDRWKGNPERYGTQDR